MRPEENVSLVYASCHGMTDVAGIGEDDICNRQKGGMKICVWVWPETDVEEVVAGLVSVVNKTRLRDADTDHSRADSGDDGDEAGNTQPCQTFQRSRQSEYQTDDGADNHEDNCTGTVVCDGVHHYREGEDMRAHDKDDEGELTGAQNFCTESPE